MYQVCTSVNTKIFLRLHCQAKTIIDVPEMKGRKGYS